MPAVVAEFPFGDPAYYAARPSIALARPDLLMEPTSRARNMHGVDLTRMLTLGGDHYITYPILRAHAKRHGPLALLQFDSHSDTWRQA